jgi:hypothetical protein
MLRNFLGFAIFALGLLLTVATVDLSIETIGTFGNWSGNDGQLVRMVLRGIVNVLAIVVSIVLLLSGLNIALGRSK